MARRAARPAGLAAAAVAWLAASVAWGAAEPLPRLGPAPNFALTTQQQDRVWLTSLRGRAVLLAFGCLRCQACPGLLDGLAHLARDLGGDAGPRAVLALVTVDPDRDTPGALRDYARAHGVHAQAWLLLTEDRRGQIDAVMRRYGVEVRPSGTGPAAQCALVLIDAVGQVRGRYGAAALDRAGAGLRALLAEPAPR